jgi:hypothetical protein
MKLPLERDGSFQEGDMEAYTRKRYGSISTTKRYGSIFTGGI